MVLNAVLCVWNEEDIIESTVKHLFAQGCSQVFIVDNDSTDDTVKNAIQAGARVAATFKTEYFNEDQKVVYLNTVVRRVNELSSEDTIWWLYVDADEFPTIDGWTIAAYVNELDPSVCAIHGYMYNHIPTHPPYYVKGYHPIDFQPLCTKTSLSKIPLLRYDKGKRHLWSIGGAHDFITHNEIIPTILDCLQIHHFPYRNPEYTFKRLKKLVDRNNQGMKRYDWDKEVSNQITKINVSSYESRYKRLHGIYKKNRYDELKIYSLNYNYTNIIRWYATHRRDVHNQISYEQSIWMAVYYFFMREYDLALCVFNDILDVCLDSNRKIWLMMKIAECLAHTDMNDTRSIIQSLKKYDNSELNAYIDGYLEAIANEYGSNTDRVCKVELYQSEFPAGVEERYKNMLLAMPDLSSL